MQKGQSRKQEERQALQDVLIAGILFALYVRDYLI